MTYKRVRMAPEDRRKQILDCALEEAKRVGYQQVDRSHISDRLGIARGLVNNYFGTLPQFRRAIMRYAIAQGCAQVVAQGLAARDPHARKAPEELKKAAIATL